MAVKVHVGFDLEALASQMIADIAAEKKNIFDAPLLLFADKKVEQWFRLFWLSAGRGKTKGPGSVVMNLRMLQLDRFLFSILQNPASPVMHELRRLTSEQLRDILLVLLLSERDGKPYYTTLQNPEVSRYLSEPGSDGTVNELHLYDFAEQMAKLFIDYEVTRPERYASGGRNDPAGFMRSWDAGKRFFAGESDSMESWQMRLYRDTCVVISSAFGAGGRFVTLPRLLSENMAAAESGEPSFYFDASGSVFMFGFSGMGQVYRTILRDFGKKHSLHVYVQGSRPAAEARNPLLAKWGAFGAENVRWWTGCGDEVTVLPRTGGEEKAGDSVLRRVQHAVAHNCLFPGNAGEELPDGSFTVTAAASKIREIEAVHSRICRLLESPGTMQSDILVLAPAISQYRTVLHEVFSEHSAGFPRLPFVIADASPEESLVCEALAVLLRLLEDGEIRRPTFFTLVRNPFVQLVRGIKNSFVESWSSWVSEMHVYRDRVGSLDWKRGARRLLLARLTDGAVGSGETALHPYSDIDSGDDECLSCFVDAVESLESFITLCREKSFTPESIDAFQEQLNGWLLYEKPGDAVFASEQEVYRGIVGEIVNQRQLVGERLAPSVGRTPFFLALKDAAKDAHTATGSLFVGGITFSSFRPNRIVPARHVFFIGLDSKAFPGEDGGNMLDLRTYSPRWLCDDSVTKKDTYAFLCQLMAAKESLHVSYVDGDLQTDEEFYRSPVINDLMRAAGYGEETVRRISIDETRRWDELYTSRSFRNKVNYCLLKGTEVPGQLLAVSPPGVVPEAGAGSGSAPDSVRLYHLRKYLEDPFRFRITRSFSSDEDGADEELSLFEPIQLDAVVKSGLLKAQVKACLQGGTAGGAGLPAAEQARLFAVGLLPQKVPFGEKALSALDATVKTTLEKLPEQLKPGSAELYIDEELELSFEMPQRWLLEGTVSPYCFKDDTLMMLDIKSKKSDKPEAFLSGYLSALGLLGSRPQVEDAYTVQLYVAGEDGFAMRVLTLSPGDAKDILQQLFKAAFIDRFSRCVPVNLLEGAPPESLAALKDKLLGTYGEWKFFVQKDSVDPMTDIGYSEENFTDKWAEAANLQRSLCRFITDEADATGSERELE